MERRVSLALTVLLSAVGVALPRPLVLPFSIFSQ